MKRFLLPETAYKCEGHEIVFGHVFENGEMTVTDDVAELIAPALVNFYGVTIEHIDEVAQTNDDGADPTLTSVQTKK